MKIKIIPECVMNEVLQYYWKDSDKILRLEQERGIFEKMATLFKYVENNLLKNFILFDQLINLYSVFNVQNN